MKFASALTAFALAGSALALPFVKREDSKSFALVTIHSGSNLQYAQVKSVDSHPHVFSVGGNEGKGVVLTLQKDSSLKASNGRGINVDPHTGEVGLVDPFGKEKPAQGFSIKENNLYYQDKQAFVACPSGDNKYSLTYNSKCHGGIGVSLYVAEADH